MLAQEDVSTHQHKHTAEILRSFKNPIEEGPFLWQLPYLEKGDWAMKSFKLRAG